ncbi:hypothetical protein ACLB2K_032561 [Fragaria x ananassa]
MAATTYPDNRWIQKRLDHGSDHDGLDDVGREVHAVTTHSPKFKVSDRSTGTRKVFDDDDNNLVDPLARLAATNDPSILDKIVPEFWKFRPIVKVSDPFDYQADRRSSQ